MEDHPDVDQIYLSPNFEDLESKDSGCQRDLVVQLKDGEKYSAAFCTYECMRSLLTDPRSKLAQPKHYLFFENLVVVDSLEKSYLNEVINEMIDEGDFQLVFKRLTVA